MRRREGGTGTGGWARMETAGDRGTREAEWWEATKMTAGGWGKAAGDAKEGNWR